MDFTIITPSLNYGRYLADCLGSVAAQDGVSFEHLVIDGGSNDETAAVAAQFTHIKWIQEPDQGMSDAINKGFNKATGQWVMWLNADDRLKPGALAAMLGRLSRSRADVVYGDYDWIDEHGVFVRSMQVPRWSAFVHIYHHCYVPSTAAFYRRSTVLDQGHRLRVDYRYVMDGEFYARLSRGGMKFEHFAENIADFRMHGGNASLRHLGDGRGMEDLLAAERQHVESRAIRRAYGVTLFFDPYLNGLVDGVLWIVAKAWKGVLKIMPRG